MRIKDACKSLKNMKILQENFNGLLLLGLSLRSKPTETKQTKTFEEKKEEKEDKAK